MNRKTLRGLGIPVLIFCLSVLGCAQTKTLTILHANDTHSAMLPFGPRELPSSPLSLAGFRSGAPGARDHGRAAYGLGPGGIARMATLIRQLRGRTPNVLALHAGDVFVGSFEFNKYFGYPELKIMEGLYDAMALGNHEFDLGLEALAGILSGQLAGGGPVGMPVLCANVRLDGTPLSAMIQPSIITTVGGIKVGIFGVVTEDKQNYGVEVAARLSGNVFAIAGEKALALKNAGCEVVICLSHLGTLRDLLGLAGNVPGINIVVGGHSHDEFNRAVVRNGKIVVQAGDYGRFLGELRVKVGGGAVALDSWQLHALDGSVKEDPAVRAELNVLRDGVVTDPRFGPVYTKQIARAARAIEKSWPASGPNRDSALGNLVADAFRWGVRNAGLPVDLALEATGYTASAIPAGKVIGNDILRAVPYGHDPASGLGFKVVVVPLPGLLLLGGLEYSVSMVPYTSDLCMQVSGLTYEYDSGKPPAAGIGQLSRLDPMSAKAGEELVALNPNKLYHVAMTDRVFGLLSGLVAPLGINLVSIPTGLFEYSVVRDYMRSLRTVDYASEGRVKDTAVK